MGDDRGQKDTAEEGECVLVLAGGDSAPVFEARVAALYRVAVPVEVGVEGWE